MRPERRSPREVGRIRAERLSRHKIFVRAHRCFVLGVRANVVPARHETFPEIPDELNSMARRLGIWRSDTEKRAAGTSEGSSSRVALHPRHSEESPKSASSC